MTKLRLALALLMVLVLVARSGADATDDAKQLVIGKWHIVTVKESTVEFTKDGKFIFVPPDKSFKPRTGTYKVTGPTSIEVEITGGLLKGEKQEKKKVKFEVTKDKLVFDPALGKAPFPSTYERDK